MFTEEKKRIGELLVKAGLVSESQLQTALKEQEKQGGRLCYNLIRLGTLRADDLLGFLREQFGVAAINLEHFQIDRSVLNLVPEDFAREHGVVPLHLLDNTLTVAMVDPSWQDGIRTLQDLTGFEIDPIIAPESCLETAVRHYYGSPPSEGTFFSAEGVLNLGEEGEEKHLYTQEPSSEGYSPEGWLKRFVLQAIKRRSREMHLEPVEEGLRVRFRISGRLQEGEVAPKRSRSAVIQRALNLARIDTNASGRVPLEGRVRINVRKRWLRANLSSFPTLYGERLVVRIMDESLIDREMQELGMSKEVADEARRILSLEHGVFLISAPPNQGKTTTLYSFLNYLKSEEGKNIMTLENPVHFPLAGVSQSQLVHGSGLDFSTGLQALLRQEPDVVGLSDIPDAKTLRMLLNASRQCLVIGLCNFPDNLQALEWIRDCGISRTTQALLIRGLLAQRLLPKICSDCRETLTEPVHIMEGIREKRPEELVFYAGRGCGRCNETGGAGRLGLFELLSFRGGLRDHLAEGSAPQIIYEEAQRQGMRPLREDGIVKATQGLVDVREVLDATVRREEMVD